jgi:hypothetical protein
MATLRIVVDGAEQRFPLEAAAVTLGRGLESDIRLKDIKASRRHCQIVKTPKGYQCVDLSSGNGTYVNGIQIKQQLLGSGDRITIGSTTVSFEDAVPAPAPKPAPARAAVSSKAPTEPVPMAAAPAAPSSRPGTVKVASEKVPVAPTRKVTARGEAEKAASQGALKPVDPPSEATPSRPLSKSASRTARPVRSASPRPSRDPDKKKPPVLLLAVVGGVLLLAVAAFFIFSSHDSGDQAKAQIDQHVKKAEKAEKAEHYDDAIQEYRKALELCQGDRHKVRASEITKLLASLDARRTAGSSGTPPPKTDPKDAPEKGPDFLGKKTEISEKHKIAGDPSAADWTGALKDWSDFLKGKVPEETRTKVSGEMAAVHTRAKEDAERLRKKADALAQENKMAEAVDLLRQQLPRFQHPALKDVSDDLQAALLKYDK